jgi:hypothetical protein
MPFKPYQPGWEGGPGRPRGSRNRLARKFLDDLAKDWEQHGAGVITIVRCEDPARYMAIVAATLPKEFIVENVEAEMEDDQIDTLLEVLTLRQRALQQKAPPMIELQANGNGKEEVATATAAEPERGRPAGRASRAHDRAVASGKVETGSSAE